MAERRERASSSERHLAKPSRPRSKIIEEAKSGMRRPVLQRRDSDKRRGDDERDTKDRSKAEKKEDRDEHHGRKTSSLNKALGATDDIEALLGLLVSQDPKRGALAMEGFERVFGKDREAIYSKGQHILSSLLQRVEGLIRNPPSDAKDKQRAQRNMDSIVRFIHTVTHCKGEARADKLLAQEVCNLNNLTILSSCLEQVGETVTFAVRLIISAFHLGPEMQDRIRKASIPQLITYQLKFRDTTLELSALLTLLAVLSQEKESAKICVDKGIIPTLVELLTVEEPRLNYQTVCVVGNLCAHLSETQEAFRKNGLEAISDLVKQSPGGSSARFLVLEAICKMINGNRTNMEAFFGVTTVLNTVIGDSLSPSRPVRERVAALKIYRQFVKRENLLASDKADAVFSDAGVKRREQVVRKGGVAPLFPLINTKKSDEAHKEMRELASEIADAIKGSFPKEVEFAASMFPKRYPNGVEEESESEVPDIETASSDLSLSSATL